VFGDGLGAARTASGSLPLFVVANARARLHPLPDADHAYGTWVEKRNYGKTYWGVQRSTFIIDPGGTIAHVIEKASPKTHDDEVLRALADAQATAT
jgi:peroxiredoxin